ncbi:hypothetical protein [Mycoplasma suis]|uniref:Uncharacterized protein n=2 Tax=Mycoplasma suis TaxID=57372 RepID=F0QRU8_MYCSL|nr:hypothetical protein [Mycoplasma suis]ADX98218.1 hypothetical protein MSU_0687 [Mycoplasma suis str. Illinois]CBZ40738.1 hypothetical protein MSUIS_06450 [Mycoplasma suis KI3806]
MLDSESKFEKVQGIWFDDIDWGVNVSYRKVDDGEDADDDCVYLASGYAYGCKKIGVKENEGTSFQQRVGKEKVKLNKNGWGLKIGKVAFSMALVEMVKKDERKGEFSKKWNDWFEEDNEESCLEVTDKGGGREHNYKKRKCKWKLKEGKKKEALEIFKKVFADESGWARKSFKKDTIDGLCKDNRKWIANDFGKDGEKVMNEVKEKFKKAHCKRNEGESNYGKGGDYVNDWSVNSSIKVIEGEVFEFEGDKSRSDKELLAFEKMGEGQDIFGKEKGGNRKISAGDWLKAARWDGTLGDQSCNSVEQWESRKWGVGDDQNQCAKGRDGGDKKWIHDQRWENIKRRFGLGKSSNKDNCQWLMKEPFKGTRHEDLRPKHTIVVKFLTDFWKMFYFEETIINSLPIN